MSAPAPRIRMRVEGGEPQLAEPAAIVISLALKFCYQPETFPVFAAYARAENAGSPYEGAMEKLHAGLLTEVNVMVCAGMVADFDEAIGGQS